MNQSTAGIIDTLKRLGAVKYDLWLPETHALMSFMHPDEVLEGIVYGRYHQAQFSEALVGRGALVVTNERVMLLDKKPAFVRCEEITFRVVSGVRYSRAGFAGTVTLNTRIGDIEVRTFNEACAKSFVAAIEKHLLADETPESYRDF
jgi:hypothetical protein